MYEILHQSLAELFTKHRMSHFAWYSFPNEGNNEILAFVLLNCLWAILEVPSQSVGSRSHQGAPTKRKFFGRKN